MLLSGAAGIAYRKSADYNDRRTDISGPGCGQIIIGIQVAGGNGAQFLEVTLASSRCSFYPDDSAAERSACTGIRWVRAFLGSKWDATAADNARWNFAI